MTAAARNVGEAAASVKAGKWERSKLVGVELKGKTLAIVGIGKGNHHHSLLSPSTDILTLPSRSHSRPHSQRLRYECHRL